MLRTNSTRALILAGLGLAATAALSAFASDAQPVAKASDWLGHAVTTRDGKELGTVRDLGIDEHSGKVIYIVVSVGSFLIENNLIAVDPDAIDPSRTADGVLLLNADPDVLRKAKRFASDGHWPATADVARAEGSAAPAPVDASVTGEPQPVPPPTTGTATIESRSKTAHLSANERTIQENPKPVPPPASAPIAPTTPTAPAAPTTPRPEPITKFDHLDKDGDGVLNRSEFAHVITPKDNYSKIDANANGVIDPPEFDAYEDSHASSN